MPKVCRQGLHRARRRPEPATLDAGSRDL